MQKDTWTSCEMNNDSGNINKLKLKPWAANDVHIHDQVDDY